MDRYAEARALVLGSRKASCSYIQRILYMGYNEAVRYMEKMEEEGFVSQPDNCGRRSLVRFNLNPIND